MGHPKKKKGHHKSKKHGQKPINGQGQQNKPLHDFKSKGQSESINSQLIAMEKNQHNMKTYLMWGILVLGALLLILGITDKSFEFEAIGIKVKGELIGAVLILVAIVMYFRNSKYKVEIEN